MRYKDIAVSLPTVRKVLCCAVSAVALMSLPAHAGNVAGQADQATEVGSIWWSEIVSANPSKSREFYTQVFGWTTKVVSAVDTSRAPTPGEDEYTIYSKGGVEVAGGASAVDASPDAKRTGWVNYIQVVNVDAAAQDAVKHGGSIIKAPYDMSGTGRFALVQDPDGILIGLVSPVGPVGNQ